MKFLRPAALALTARVKNMRLFPKYLLSHGLVTLLTAIVISIVSFGLAKDEIEVNARASTRTIMEQMGLLLEKNGSELQKNLVAQLEQADIYRILRESGKRLDSADRLELEHGVARLLSTNRWITSFFYRSPYGEELYMASDGFSPDPAEIRGFAPAVIEYLHGRAYWYSDRLENAYFCKQLYDLETTANLGTLALGVAPSFFETVSSSIGRSRGLGSFFVLSKDSSEIIFHSKSTEAAHELVSSWAEERKTPPRTVEAAGASYLVSALVTDSQNWEIINIVTEGELTALSARTGLLILETTLGILAIALVLAFFLARGEVGKITSIVAQTRLISGGDFAPAAGFRSSDELGELEAEIRSMASEIGDLVNKVAAERNQKTEAELRALRFEYSALQSRINPHFISNTLELINSRSKLRGAPEIGEVACLLGDLMRESIRRKEDLISLEEELEHCGIYLHIQEILLESRLNVSYEIDERLLGCKVPNLILQPIIENAVIHGIEPKMGKSELRIAARSSGTVLELAVEDDGVGMTAERLGECLSSRSPDSVAKIGLESVDKRVKILFGQAYGVSIESEAGTGTKVLVSMPLIEGGL
jgi:two-component system, sensor histidine kinase YesM